MESQPQNPEFRNNPVNLHPCFDRILITKAILEHPDKPDTYIFRYCYISKHFSVIHAYKTTSTGLYSKKFGLAAFYEILEQQLLHSSNTSESHTLHSCHCFSSQSTIITLIILTPYHLHKLI